MNLKIALVLLLVSVFFNTVQFGVLLDYENEYLQLNEAVQYLGHDCIKIENNIAQGLCLEKLW